VGHPVAKTPFDRGKPFYPLIMQYLIQLVGFREVATRSVIGGPDTKQAIAKLIGQSEGKVTDAAKLTQDLERLLGPLELRSSGGADNLQIPIDDIATELRANIRFLSTSFFLSAGTVLILAHELCKDKPAHNADPLWEFLRHCRNAAGHGGKFHFLHGEPRRPAKWRAFEITSSMQGKPLFPIEGEVGFLAPADPLLLLWDIEQAYPTLT
jgi:hypothetical protein